MPLCPKYYILNSTFFNKGLYIMLCSDMIRVRLNYSMGPSPIHILNLKDIKA